MIAALAGEDVVAILGAYTALVLGLFGLMLKFLVETRNEAKAVNKAVNNRPQDEPSIYERVASIEGAVSRLDTKVTRQGDTQTARHHENLGRIRDIRESVSRVEGRVVALERQEDE